MPYKYFETDGTNFFVNISHYNHPKWNINATLAPLSHIADKSYYHTIVQHIGDRPCMFDLTLIDHPAFFELHRTLAHEPDFLKILEYVRNFPLFKNNATPIQEFFAHHIMEEVQPCVMNAENLIATMKNDKLRLIFEISKRSAFDGGNIMLCQRFLAEQLEVTTTTSGFDSAIFPQVQEWAVILLNGKPYKDLDHIKLELTPQTLQQWNQNVFNVLDALYEFGRYLLIPEISSRRRTYGAFLLNVNKVINDNIQQLIPSSFEGNPEAQTVNSFIQTMTTEKKDLGLVFGALNCPYIEDLLLKQGFVKETRVNQIPIFK